MSRSRLLLIGLLAGSCVGGLAIAAPPAVNAPAAAISATDRQETMPLTQMGANSVAQLTGTKDTVDLPFGIPLDAVVVRAHLRLYLTASPALIEQLSHLKVVLNDQVIAAIALPKSDAGREVIRDLELDPLHFTDYNHLRLQFIGHYAMECEDPAHSSLWLALGNQSRLELELRPLGLRGDLGLLPAPFFDRRSAARLELPFVFAAKPTLDTVRAAGVVASWFGALASYRGARFPVLLNRLPAHHGVVFLTNPEAADLLKLPPVDGPTIAVVDHPSDPAVKLLVLQGRDAADLQTAANALVLGQAVLTGASVSVSQADIGRRRPAYDAPNWLRTDRPVRLGELVDDPEQLQARGHAPDPIRINMRIPPDLLPWHRSGVPMDLKYQYTPPIESDSSRLTISINDQFVKALPLKPGGQESVSSRLLIPLLNGGPAQARDEVLLPAFEIGSDNQAQFRFSLDYPHDERCKSLPEDSLRSALDPDSTIDFSGFPHYTAMPNLALFANAGFPFTKYADLAETTVVLPDQPTAPDLETLLFVLGRTGRITGAPALRYQLIGTGALGKAGDSDLLLIGAGRGGDTLAAWSKDLAVLLDGKQRQLRALTRPSGLAGNAPPPPSPAATPWQVAVQAEGPFAAIIGFQSPLQPGRSVVALASTAPEQEADIVNALEDGALVSRIRGDTVLIRGHGVDSFQGEQPYFVGQLSWWQRLWFWMSRYPLLLTGLGVVAALLFAVWVYGVFRRAAARRLN